MTMLIEPRLARHYRHIAHLLESMDAWAKPWATATPRSPRPWGNLVVFPGSFNPPTLAHLSMLRSARAFLRREEGGTWGVYAALSRQIVDKEAVERMTQLDRVVLLERVLARYVPRSGILLLNRGLYVEQARGIWRAFPRVKQLWFLVGFDKIVQILDPRYYDDRESQLRELFSLAHLLVAPRADAGPDELRALLERKENRPFAPSMRALPLAERYRSISSSHARLTPTLESVPREVRDFIQRTRPYEPSEILPDGSQRDRYAERTRDLKKLLTP